MASGTVLPTAKRFATQVGSSEMGQGEQDDRVDLLDQARQGDGTALNQLLEFLQPEIRTYLKGQIQSHPSSSAQAEELTQEVLLRIARSIESCQANSAGELWSWIRSIARNVVTDRYRKRKGELDRRIWSSDETLLARATLHQVFGGGSGSNAGDVRADLDIVVGRILLEAQGELSAGTQEVVRRHVLLDETWRETGEAIGTTGPGAKRRWQRALDRLRKEVLNRIDELPQPLRQAALNRLGR